MTGIRTRHSRARVPGLQLPEGQDGAQNRGEHQGQQLCAEFPEGPEPQPARRQHQRVALVADRSEEPALCTDRHLLEQRIDAEIKAARDRIATLNIDRVSNYFPIIKIHRGCNSDLVQTSGMGVRVALRSGLWMRRGE